MKNFLCLFLSLCMIASNQLQAQNKKQQAISVDQIKNYDQLKASGQLEKLYPQFAAPRQESRPVQKTETPRFGLIKSSHGTMELPSLSSTACQSCFEPVDPLLDTIVAFTIGAAPDFRNDDGSTVQMGLPFNFCFYGDTFNYFWVNNNGNVSFNNAVGTYSASGFPDPTAVMVAPFWGDVDTRNGNSGLVYIRRTPHYVKIKWDHVGYFNSQADKVNNFQLIISDGTDPIVPDGNNVRFCYGDMQWTTGSASQGVNGFGGVPATVGANRGNGSDFIQFGRFDHPGTDYDGPASTTNPDGISWLDYQTFTFSTCFANNVAPIITGLGLCDTLTVCSYDTANINIGFLAPEANQSTTITSNADTIPGITVVSNTPGNNASIQLQIVGSPSNIGYHTVTITGTDDGSPAASTSATLIIHVIDFAATASHTDAACNTSNGTIVLHGISAGSNFEYSINGGTTFQTDTLFSNLAGGYYNCIVRVPGGCSFDTTIFVFQPSSFAPPPGNSSPACVGTSVNLTVPTIAGATYSWTGPNGFTSTTQNPVLNNIASADTGLYCVTLVTNGCAGTPNCTRVSINIPQVNAGSDQSICGNDTIQLNATYSGTSIGASWSGGQGTFFGAGSASTGYVPSISEQAGDTLFLVATSQENGTCQPARDTMRVIITPAPIVVLNGSFVTVCAGTPVNFGAAVAGSATGGTWSNGNGTFSPSTTALTGTYTPSAAEVGAGQVNLVFTSNTAACGFDRDTIRVTIRQNPTGFLTHNPIIGVGSTRCAPNDSTVTLTLSGFAPWNIGLNGPNGHLNIFVPSSPYVLNLSTAGSYTLDSITDANTCRVTGNLSSVLVTRVEIGASAAHTVEWCDLQNARASVAPSLNGVPGGPFRYTWRDLSNNLQVGGNNDTLFAVGSGSYQVTITDSLNGCRFLDTVQIASILPFTAGIAADTTVGAVPLTVVFSNTTTLNDPLVSGLTYIWDFGNGASATTNSLGATATYTFNSDSLYTVILTAKLSNTCMDTAAILIKPEFPPNVNPPNVFTPGNGDNLNELFRINPLGIRTFTCQVFDRWGREVYKWNDPANGWDGKNADSGVYYYVMNYETKTGTELKTLTGFIQLLR